METLSTILEQFGKPLSLVTLCSSTFGFFVFIENMSDTGASRFRTIPQIDRFR